MIRFSSLAASGLAAALFLAASGALADSILLLPARGQVPGQLVSASIERETKFVLLELGHVLVAPDEVQAAMREVQDGQPNGADEFTAMTRATKSAWLVLPTVSAAGDRYRLELTVFQTSAGRVENVARDIDVNAVHQQVLEMATVLLRPEGVGTGALPWEQPVVHPAPGSATPSPSAGESKRFTLAPLAGLGLGVSAALKRPDGATGASTAMFGALRAGVGLGKSIEVALSLRDHLSGPRAVTADGAVRYMFALTPSGNVRVGPEAGVGAFVQRGGAQNTSLMLRVNAVASVKIAGPLSVEATMGDLTWVSASSGSILLGGGAVYAVARF